MAHTISSTLTALPDPDEWPRVPDPVLVGSIALTHEQHISKVFGICQEENEKIRIF